VVEEIIRFPTSSTKDPPKFLDLDFIPEAFPVSYSKQLEAKNREFEHE
jgi:hypothetical protein